MILASETLATLERVVAAFVLKFKILLGCVVVLQVDALNYCNIYFNCQKDYGA